MQGLCTMMARPDGDSILIEDLGHIVRVSPDNPRTLETVVVNGRDPAWQPVELGPVSPARASALGTRP